jgi:hypothetical protein
MTDQKINLSISEGDAFFGHELSINFNPQQFIFDFKNVTPRVDPRSKDHPTLVMKHNVVMMTPYHAKMMKELLDKVIKKYEKEFCKIEKPEAVKIYEKKKKKSSKKSDNVAKEAPTYFG